MKFTSTTKLSSAILYTFLLFSCVLSAQIPDYYIDIDFTKQGDALKLELELSGDPIPQDIQVLINNNSFKLEKKTNSTFEYTLLNLRQNSSFYFQALGYDSETYEITVLPNPAIVKFEIQVNYPNYLHNYQYYNLFYNTLGYLIILKQL